VCAPCGFHPLPYLSRSHEGILSIVPSGGAVLKFSGYIDTGTVPASGPSSLLDVHDDRVLAGDTSLGRCRFEDTMINQPDE